MSDRTKSFELAKDVCAFANHLGGTIIVGAIEGRGERRGRIGAFHSLVAPSAGDLVKELDRVIKGFCIPVPVANAITIDLDADQAKQILERAADPTTIVAINIEPTLNGPIGCLTCVDHSKSCKQQGTTCMCTGSAVPDAWRFPVRVVEGTDLLRPDQIARRMNVTERRALLELQAIDLDSKFTIWCSAGSTSGMELPCKLVKLDTEIMMLVTELWFVPDAPRAEIPLAFVRATWRNSTGYNVAIEGCAFDGAGPTRRGFRPI